MPSLQMKKLRQGVEAICPKHTLRVGGRADSNSDSLSPVSGLLSHALYNPKGKLTVFQVLLPSQFREVRSHTENLSTCALLTSGYKSSQRKQNNELTEVVSGAEDQGTWDMARRTPEVCFPVKTFPSIFVSLSPRQTGRLTVMPVVTQTGTERERDKSSHAPRGTRCGQHTAARKGGPVGTGNHYSSPFRSFCGKPRLRASLPSSTGISHSPTVNS